MSPRLHPKLAVAARLETTDLAPVERNCRALLEEIVIERVHIDGPLAGLLGKRREPAFPGRAACQRQHCREQRRSTKSCHCPGISPFFPKPIAEINSRLEYFHRFAYYQAGLRSIPGDRIIMGVFKRLGCLLLLLLAGCATKLIPDDYQGQTAILRDSY